MFSPILVVTDLSKNGKIEICRTPVGVDRDHWKWDKNKCEWLDLSEFRKLITYISSDHKYFATVVPSTTILKEK